MAKTTFKFVFPTKNQEYEALCNPMHIEVAATLAMAQHSTNLCHVFYNEDLLFIVSWDPKTNAPHFFYEKKDEEYQVALMIADADTISDIELYTIEDFMNEHESSDYHLVYETFETPEEAHAFLKGIEVFIDGQHQEYCHIDEKTYQTLNNRED